MTKTTKRGGKGLVGKGRKVAALAVLVVAVSLSSGCSLLKSDNQSTYVVTLAATGTVPVPLQELGHFSVPAEAANLTQLGIGLAAGLVSKQLHWKDCSFDAALSSPGGGVVQVAVAATCTLQGIPVAESVAVTFTPA